MKNKKIYSALDIKFTHPIKKVDNEKIINEEIDNDPIFMKLYINHLLGKCPSAQTRLSITKIKPGFVKNNSSGKPQYKFSSIDTDLLNWMTVQILNGSRPSLFVYKSPIIKNKFFYCPDDLSSYYAYKECGLSVVPVQILNYKPADLEESALILSSIGEGKNSEICYMGNEIPEIKKIGSYISRKQMRDLFSTISILRKEINRTFSKIRLFHYKMPKGLHYHNILASVLFRTERNLKAIYLLSKKGLQEQAILQLRELYEIFLNYYLLWLGPELLGPYIQLYSIGYDKELKTRRKTDLSNKSKKGWNDSTIGKLIKADNRLKDLLTKVSEKAKISPMYSVHNDFYKFLSEVAHQEFYIAARYAGTLDKTKPFQKEPELNSYIAQYISIITTQILERINSDIGEEDITKRIKTRINKYYSKTKKPEPAFGVDFT